MDQRDQELLDKQLKGISAKRNDGVIVLLLVAVFLAGTTLGSFLFGHDRELTRFASTETGTSFPIGAPDIALQ